jgi:hypothetical protein
VYRFQISLESSQITHYLATLLISQYLLYVCVQNIPVPAKKITAGRDKKVSADRASYLFGNQYHYHSGIKSNLLVLLNFFYKVL